ncbi:GNAT family N-acetyltransferase [Pseudohoeflea coraliihabitans]|uniref:GNAT family N-acetyltransferase n=1 Tax=Pseudohoeflea coraliihabitans TaxID=2860393 RepID=UPI002101DA28|nr:GNAT family N-acetyltransferase [Pseudohoeflea sp. DP4N28-3]
MARGPRRSKDAVSAESPPARKATVTWLECARPPRRVPPLPINLHATLLRTRKIPLHFYRYLYWQIGRHWHWVHRLRLSDSELAALVHAPGVEIRVLSLDGAPVGLFELNRDDPATTNLVYFGLMQEARGLGLGKWFLGQAMMTAWNEPIERMTVSTNTLDHPAALGLYQKLGFTPTGQSEAMILPLSDAELLAAIKAGDAGAEPPPSKNA